MRRVLKILSVIIGIIVIVIAVLLLYVMAVGEVTEPEPHATSNVDTSVVEVDRGLFRSGNSWFRKSESGLYELYIEGEAYQRGVAIGKLSKNLIQYQEEVFNKQINQLVPSSFYRGMLKYFVGWFNRDLDANVPEEYRQEIYGVSRVASSAYDNIAPAYQRILNYHAAHDIGHALQNMSLVGCTSFATWGSRSEDSTLIIGRNFDFYVGDDFAKNKIVAFYNPANGNKFMMVTFGGMTGVLSGMNEEGLTVTLNAAKCDIPSASATPVSLVAREILQYASTIDEAFQIASKRKMFVAESLLIGSARDKKAAIIEKTPDATVLYQENDEDIISTNHFQSDSLGNTELNKEHMRTSASPYRYERVRQLLDANGRNSVHKTAVILRDQNGMNNKSIGLGNEKSINQLIAHHAVIFEPEKKLVWISTAPWQLGKFVCYDLSRVFTQAMDKNEEIQEAGLAIPADSFLLSREFSNALKFNRYRFPFQSRDDLNPDSLIKWNPNSYLSYMLAGDFYVDHKDYASAKRVYETALEKEIATHQEKDHIQENLQRCNEKLK
jgi:isopenicillin-N N-acyltransferase like protein